MATMSIINRDGTATSAMAQMQVESYLQKPNLISAGSGLAANLKQSLNQAFNGQGKQTAGQMFNMNGVNYPVLHASSGNGQKSVTLFYFVNGTVLNLFAIGEHSTGTSYKISIYGQDTGNPSFRQNATIRL